MTLRRLLLLVLALLAPPAAARADAPRLLDLRHWVGPGRTRVVLDLSAPVDYRAERQELPRRLVVHLPSLGLPLREPKQPASGPVRHIAIERTEDGCDLLLELAPGAGTSTFALPADHEHPVRVVIDVVPGADRSDAAPLRAPGAGQPYVVVLDPGHGGADAGTLGCGIAVEKDVVLGIARVTAAVLQAHGGFDVVLTRSDDRRVALQDRVDMARDSGGDLFVSIHANSAADRQARGAEVYFLSVRGATDETAAELADRENAAALMGLRPEQAQDDDLVSILVDLQGSAVMHRSSILAELALDEIHKEGGVASRSVKQARFAVLRNLSMPAILVEAGFLSNSAEARRLRSKAGQQEMGVALARAVVEYCRRHGEKGDIEPLGKLRVHTVHHGDTLWELALAYGTSVETIQMANGLRGSRLHVGQRLLLP